MESVLVNRRIRRHFINKTDFVGYISFPLFFEGELILISLDEINFEPKTLIRQSWEAVAYVPKELIGKTVKVKLSAGKMIEYAKKILERPYDTYITRHIKRRPDD